MVGVARAAYELALAYAKERVQGGIPIIQHQDVKLRLFNMFRKVEISRALARHVMITNATLEVPLMQLATSVKVTTTDISFEVANDAMKIFGGYGISQEYPIEKLFRDARMSLIADGTNEVLSLMAATRL